MFIEKLNRLSEAIWMFNLAFWIADVPIVRGWTFHGDKLFVAIEGGVLIFPKDRNHVQFISNSFYDDHDYR